MPVKFKRHPATPATQERATRFIRWYGRSERYLKRKIQSNWDEDIAQDTALNIYDLILYAHIRIESYYNYFRRAYFANMLLERRRAQRFISIHVFKRDSERLSENEYLYQDGEVLKEALVTDEDVEAEELLAEDRREEYLHFVRANFSESEIIIFEIYLELFETLKATRIAELLGIKYSKFHKVISKIRTRLAEVF